MHIISQKLDAIWKLIRVCNHSAIFISLFQVPPDDNQLPVQCSVQSEASYLAEALCQLHQPLLQGLTTTLLQ